MPKDILQCVYNWMKSSSSYQNNLKYNAIKYELRMYFCMYIIHNIQEYIMYKYVFITCIIKNELNFRYNKITTLETWVPRPHLCTSNKVFNWQITIALKFYWDSEVLFLQLLWQQLWVLAGRPCVPTSISYLTDSGKICQLIIYNTLNCSSFNVKCNFSFNCKHTPIYP